MLSIVALALLAQWTHRYPKVEGYNHHVYLEGYELPVLNPGPSDPAPVERVEVLVNGKVVFEDDGLGTPGKKSYSGRVPLPEGGWIAARARGGETAWPSMDSYSFAHTAPLWVGRVGSTHREAARASARELLAWLDVADKRLAEGYEGAEIPELTERFTQARWKLEALSRE